MYAWLIAHNLGIVLMMIPCAILAKIIITVEDRIKERMMIKKLEKELNKSLTEKA